MPSNILVVGSLNLDLVLHVPRMPAAGETLASDGSATFCGGKGANQAVACARLGAAVSMIGRLGDDPAGASLRRALTDEEIETSGVIETPGAASGLAVILLTPDGQNRILLSAGANARLCPEDLSAQAAQFDAAKILVCQLEVPLETVGTAVNMAVARGVPVLLNPAPARTLPNALLGMADYLVPNETEASLITGMAVADVASAESAADQLRARGARCVIVTLGGLGIVVADDHGTRHMPALATTVVDTTAAGDSFIGGFATGIAQGLTTDDAARLGLKVARLCVSRPGAQASLPRRHEL